MGATETAKKPGTRRLNAALSDRKVKAAKPGRHFDGHGLFLLVSPAGGKLWKQRIAIHGRRVELGLGGYPVVTLAAAREATLENCRMVRAGHDPRIERRRAAAEMLTFEAAAGEVHKFYRERWRSEKYADEWLASLARDVFPKIGTRAVNAIDVQDVIDVLMPVYRDRAVSAKRVGQRIGVVLKWAIAQRLRADNPVEAAKVLLPKRAPETPRRALHYSDVPAAVEVVRGSSCDTSTKAMVPMVAEMNIICVRQRSPPSNSNNSHAEFVPVCQWVTRRDLQGPSGGVSTSRQLPLARPEESHVVVNVPPVADENIKLKLH